MTCLVLSRTGVRARSVDRSTAKMQTPPKAASLAARGVCCVLIAGLRRAVSTVLVLARLGSWMRGVIGLSHALRREVRVNLRRRKRPVPKKFLDGP